MWVWETRPYRSPQLRDGFFMTLTTQEIASIKGSIVGWLGTNKANNLLENNSSFNMFEKEFLGRQKRKAQKYIGIYLKNTEYCSRFFKRMIQERRKHLNLQTTQKRINVNVESKVEMLKFFIDKGKTMDKTNLTKEQLSYILLVSTYANKELENIVNDLAKAK